MAAQADLKLGFEPFPVAEEGAFLLLQRAAGWLGSRFAIWLKEFRLTPTQYNALRILRGAAPQALACGEVGRRLVTPDPDVTRLLDRLVKRGLAARFRDEADRRVVRVAITAGGLALLEEIEPGLTRWMREAFGGLSGEELHGLRGMLDRLAAEPCDGACRDGYATDSARRGAAPEAAAEAGAEAARRPVQE
jgi:DNA-binding MarR family transcriptional regulator